MRARKFTPWRCNISRWAVSSLGLALLLAGCHAAQDSDGYVVGNGGDLGRAKLEHARQIALNRLALATAVRLVSRRDTADWVTKRGAALAAEVREMPVRWTASLPLSLCPEHPPTTCGCTSSVLGATAWFSQAACGDAPVEHLAEVLFHEAVHHVHRGSESQVYALGAQLFFAEGLLSVSAQRHAFPNADARRLPVTFFDGRVAAWDRRDESFHLLSHDRWSRLEPATPSHRAARSAHSPRWEPSQWLFSAGAKQLFVFAFAGQPELRCESWRLSLVTDETTALQPVECPAYRFQNVAPWGLVAPFTERGTVAAGLTLNREESVVSLFQAGPNVWSFRATEELNPIHFNVSSPALSDTNLYVARAPRTSGSDAPLLQMSVEKDGWRALPTLDAPVPLHGPTVVGLPQGVLVYGGWRAETEVGRPADFIRQGAWYSERSNRWTKIATPGPRSAGPPLLFAAEPDLIHFFGREWMTFSAERNEWQLVHADFAPLSAGATRVSLTPTKILFWDDVSGAGWWVAR